MAVQACLPGGQSRRFGKRRCCLDVMSRPSKMVGLMRKNSEALLPR